MLPRSDCKVFHKANGTYGTVLAATTTHVCKFEPSSERRRHKNPPTNLFLSHFSREGRDTPRVCDSVYDNIRAFGRFRGWSDNKRQRHDEDDVWRKAHEPTWWYTKRTKTNNNYLHASHKYLFSFPILRSPRFFSFMLLRYLIGLVEWWPIRTAYNHYYDARKTNKHHCRMCRQSLLLMLCVRRWVLGWRRNGYIIKNKKRYREAAVWDNRF